MLDKSALRQQLGLSILPRWSIVLMEMLEVLQASYFCHIVCANASNGVYRKDELICIR